MENMGRPSDGRIGPVGIEHLYPDPDAPLAVELLINRGYPDLRGQHWAISEIGCDHYTNWGPLTRSFEPRDYGAVPIALLTLEQRRTLDSIAARTEVCIPNGDWNCQDWVIEVLGGAVEAGVLSTAERDAALRVGQS
ncbi:hypothetical protein FB451DRAFT_1411260 [Mycena latifolia]|nr:hypothetical protein FB451DRAFT_1411260 [Mycena latifolia]